nr:extracellular protease inhibitor 10-like [Procambarus clarkii]
MMAGGIVRGAAALVLVALVVAQFTMADPQGLDDDERLIDLPDNGCSALCSKIYRPVCGSNGVTYSNQCRLEYAQCLGNPVKKVHNGPCADKDDDVDNGLLLALLYGRHRHVATLAAEGIKGTEASVAPSVPHQPGRRYHRSTRTMARLVPLVAAVPLVALLLLLPHFNMAAEGDECPTACPEDYTPVCGTNGATYSNLCSLESAKCKDKTIDLAYGGQCEKDNSSEENFFN